MCVRVCACSRARARAVSYTHLDVYKRQPSNYYLTTVLSLSLQNIINNINNFMSLYFIITSNSNLWVSSVSYTHLDVYKRQHVTLEKRPIINL